MSSRKRRNSPDQGTENILSKRAKLLSDLWKSQEEVVGITQGSQSSPSSSVYRIKGIVGERSTEYLIDWADDPITGEKFKPDWQPKKNVNTAAVQAWEQKNSSILASISDRPNRQRQKQKRRRPDADRPCTSSDIAAKAQSPQRQHISETPSHEGNNSYHLKDKRDIFGSSRYTPSRSNINGPKVVVQVSQHSSFDRDLYVAYQSPLPTQDKPASFIAHSEHSDSETGISLLPAALDSNSIIPDSQSLPGSSSYAPTSCASSAVLGVDQAPPIRRSRISCNSTDIESTAGGLADVIESSEVSSAIVVATSQPSVTSSARSRSEPLRGTIDSFSASPSGARLPSLPRRTSDPTSTYHSHHQRQIIAPKHPSGDRTKLDQIIQYSAGFQSFPQVGTEHTQQGQSSSGVQVPGSADRISPQYHEAEDSPTHSLVFQTQVPLAFASQGSRVSVTSAEEQLQKDQSIPQSVEGISEISSGSVERSSGRIDQHPSISKGISEIDDHRNRHRPSTSEILAILEDRIDSTHLSQATTTDDDSILSQRDHNSQSTRQNHRDLAKEEILYLEDPTENPTKIESSSMSDNRLALPDTLDSQEPPKPPLSSKDGMSDTAPNDSGLREGMQPLRIRATLKRIREDGEAKRVAARSGKRQHSESSTARTSPSLARDDRESSKMTNTVGLSSLISDQLDQSALLAGGESPDPSRNEHTRPSPLASIPSPPVTREELHVRMQSPVEAPSMRSTASPSIIPAKAPYQVQEEPSRLEIQPSMVMKELSLPARNPQSAPHTPTTPSKLSIHKEASPPQSQTTTLKVRNLGPREFIVPLPMQPRILSQYVDTIEYFPQAISSNMTEETISDDVVEKLNTLLYRLGNVATHIGLEGGGPGSQEEVNPEEEALYAELSSEKFKFLGHLLALTKESQLHIAVVAKPGHLLDIIEMFLKGKKVSYSRPDTRTKVLRHGPGSPGSQTVSIIPSGEAISFPPAHLIIAFDETFNARNAHVAKCREDRTSTDQLTPVIRLVVYSSVEHLDLCLARSLEPIDRIRKLIFCVWHTQRFVGQLEPNEPDPATCARKVFESLNSGSDTFAWTLANIRPIENLPVMDSDSSLSDAISDISDVCKPEGAPTYYPNPILPFVTNPNDPDALPRGKRPFDLEYGDSLEVQAKKRKMLADYNAGRLNDPPTIESLTAEIQECKVTEKLWEAEKKHMNETIKNLRYWAERRQYDYEELRDKAGDHRATIQERDVELEKAKKDTAKARTEIMALKNERGTIQKELATARDALINHQDPIVRDTAIKDARIRDLEAEVLAKNKKLESLTKDWDFSKRLWTDASAAAATATQELAALEAKQPDLLRRAAEHETKHKELANDATIRALQKEVAFQKATVKNRDNLIRRKEEQIAELKRGRGGGVQTRGSSVQPRSPRGGSRGASPAAGMLGGTGGKGGSGLGSRLGLLDG